MTESEFLNALKTRKASEIRRVLESEYTPSSQEEIQLLCEVGLVAHQSFQEKSLEIALRTDIGFARPILEKLARFGINWNIREKALDRLLQEDISQALKTIMTCCNDENLQIQKKALLGLRGCNDPQVITFLIDRMSNPQAALPPNDSSHVGEVRQWAIEALATEGATKAITPLVELMLSEAKYRQAIKNTLVTIGGNQVVETLLDASEGNLEDSPEPDESFKLDAVEFIVSLDLRKFAPEQLVRYRKLLGDIYPTALQQLSSHKYVLEEVAKRIDDRLLEIIKNEFTKNIESKIASEIVTSLQYCNLKTSTPFLLDVFEQWRPNFRDAAKSTFLELVRAHPGQTIPFLEEALRSGGSKNQQDRLPSLVAGFDDPLKLSIAKSLAPMFDEPQPREYLQAYYKSIWDITETEKREELVRPLLRTSYNTDEALDQVAKFLALRWSQVVKEEVSKKLVVDVLLEEWFVKNQQPRIEAITARMTSIVDNKHQWCLEMATRASEEGRGRQWKLFEIAFEDIPIEDQVQAIIEVVTKQWHRKLVERLLRLNKEQAALVLREHLGKTGDEALKGSERKWALWALGECGSEADFKLLGVEVEGKSVPCAVAAVKAIGAIDANAGQAQFREALESRKPGVVMGALEALEGIHILEIETIQALCRRVGAEEGDKEIREKAVSVVEKLRSQHLSVRPSPDIALGEIQRWLAELDAFGQSDTSGQALQKFLIDLDEREAPELRKLLANSIAICCPPQMGIKMSEKEIQVVRRPDVRAAWQTALDRLKGLPDRGVFQLVERVCGKELDRDALLGQLGLSEIFKNPTETLLGLNRRLRRAEQVREDPNTLVTVLDGTAELLIDELLWARGEEPERFANQYGNKIGFTKGVLLRAARHAENLHGIRGSAIDPHPRDAAGALREGVEPHEAEEARASFLGLFQEVVRFLREKKEESGETEITL